MKRLRVTAVLKAASAVSAVSAVLMAAAGAFDASPAQAAQGWSGQPGWASSSEPAQRKRPSIRDDAFDLAPFTPGSNNLSLDVGQVFLMGDLSSNFNDSIGSRLHYTYGVSDMFAFDSSLGYSSHSSGKMSMTTLLSGMRMNLAWYDKIVPYVVFGMGFYRPSYDIMVGNVRNAVSPVLFGIHLGPGVSLELTRRMFFGASLTFHNIFGSQTVLTDGSSMNVGGAFTSFFLNAGVTF